LPSSKPNETPTEHAGWVNHRVEQLRSNLCLSHAERLRWLVEVNATMRSMLGRARAGRRESPESR
jgi:hypothetical protein